MTARYPRGQYPRSALAAIPAYNPITGQYTTVLVIKETAAAFMAWRAYEFARTGSWMYATAPFGGYRSTGDEIYMHTHPSRFWPVLAPVGASNHNEADVIDLWNWAVFGDAELDRSGRTFGFSQTVASENWHRQHDRTGKYLTTPTTKGTEMELELLYVATGSGKTALRTYYTFDGYTVQFAGVSVKGSTGKSVGVRLSNLRTLFASRKATEAQLTALREQGALHLAAIRS